MIIAFPPCTYLTNCATRAFSLRVTPADKVVKRWENRAKAAVFFMHFALARCDKIVIENPVGFMNGAYRKPDQIIQPYYFAASQNDVENYQLKKTCLWLKGVKPLERTNDLPKPQPIAVKHHDDGSTKNYYFEEFHGVIDGKKQGENDAVARSKTFPAVAQAMADQWG